MTIDPSPTAAAPITAQAGARFQWAAAIVAGVAALLLVTQSDADIWDVVKVAAGYGLGMSTVIVIILLVQFIWVGFRQRRAADTAHPALETAWYRAFLARLRKGDIAVATASLIVTVSSFTVYKGTVVGAGGYRYDALFIMWDRFIFAGQDPWTLTHTLLSSPIATKVIDFLYHPAFLPMVLGYLASVAIPARPALRYTYMISYLASFVLIGMVMANAMNSAGPIYDGALFGDGSTFGPLVDLLARQNETAGPFAAVFAQEYLLTLNQRGLTGLGGGISAMPSMHIVLAFLWVFGAWHLNRVLGICVTIYAAVIWFGSVHLGWHYFVDGLIGVSVLAVIWYVAGRLFGLYPRGQVIRATT